ncbi:hypothetical protein EPUS_00831 [Endocarpon pusillum Z07020]|uniref:G domain-containing protein n=1 Tax=Endocarpon pusillum (strain Z07020 / HMAS-L-300199) TaxID=1263415 RepID=U1GRU5_ENDPU|nr:uncharacterized protein EPUS_00831 [Endocarpon pusillum Z07020]ERF74701.1 hypothetical protein EPUS_00831 [Endocarpon pusillum Z07020]
MSFEPYQRSYGNDNATDSSSGKGEKLNEMHSEDVVIAVMGVTGTGKSTFQIGIRPMQYRDGPTIYLIDTPGFDDTRRTDA